MFSNADYPHKNKIDITIVVDMLLTGFDSKYLNTLYVDKNLKYHGLIQAFSRTNRVLNDTKPYGNILDFRQQQRQVDGNSPFWVGVKKKKKQEPSQGKLAVEPAPKVIERFEKAVTAKTNGCRTTIWLPSHRSLQHQGDAPLFYKLF
jgi:type I restriction enzyme R subunit